MSDQMQSLFASGQLGGGAAPNSEKPAIAITAPFLLFGINGADAKGIDNLNSTSIIGKDLFATPENGGAAILSLSTKPDAKNANFMQKIMQSASADLSKMNKENAPTGSSGSGGGSSSGSSSDTFTASSGGGGSSSAPVSSGGGNLVGGGTTGLTAAIAQASGISASMGEHFVSTPMAQAQIDHTPTAPSATPQVAANDASFSLQA